MNKPPAKDAVLDETATLYGAETYLPEIQARRSGVAICLSGGGFRAALFHLGALRRLNELGILSRVDTVSSVSGGSIIAAHLADRIRKWPPPGGTVNSWEQDIAMPFHAFAARNLRTGPLLKRLLPPNWFRSSTAVEALAQSYEKGLTRRKLHELPTRPRFIFCATEMAFGVNWTFQADRAGDYQAGYLTTPADWSVARAVAASSCFPPVFDPMPLNLRPEQLSGGSVPRTHERDKLVEGIRLTDGGVYDNMGLEPVWKSHKVVLVSDGGATFGFEWDRGLLWRLSRYTSIVGRQASALRKRWLIAGFLTGGMEGAYWGIGSATTHYDPATSAGYSQTLVESVISRVRTDMDAFSKAERSVLENHGYLLADAAAHRHRPSVVSPDAPPLAVPHPEWMSEDKVRRALKHSHERRLPFGRF